MPYQTFETFSYCEFFETVKYIIIALANYYDFWYTLIVPSCFHCFYCQDRWFNSFDKHIVIRIKMSPICSVLFSTIWGSQSLKL